MPRKAVDPFDNSSGITRVPRGETNTTLAPNATNTGAVSLDAAATHRLPLATTWQTVPSFFRQKPSACRQKWLWLM